MTSKRAFMFLICEKQALVVVEVYGEKNLANGAKSMKFGTEVH